MGLRQKWSRDVIIPLERILKPEDHGDINVQHAVYLLPSPRPLLNAGNAKGKEEPK